MIPPEKKLTQSVEDLNVNILINGRGGCKGVLGKPADPEVTGRPLRVHGERCGQRLEPLLVLSPVGPPQQEEEDIGKRLEVLNTEFDDSSSLY